MKRQRGATLIELTVGLAIAAVLLLVVTDLEVRGWRFRRLDEQQVVQKTQAATALDLFAADGRQATAITLAGATTITLTLPSGPVVYRYDPAAGEFVRQEAGAVRTLARNLSGVLFTTEDGARTVHLALTTRLPGGGSLTLRTVAARRVGP